MTVVRLYVKNILRLHIVCIEKHLVQVLQYNLFFSFTLSVQHKSNLLFTTLVTHDKKKLLLDDSSMFTHLWYITTFAHNLSFNEFSKPLVRML